MQKFCDFIILETQILINKLSVILLCILNKIKAYICFLC